MDNCFKWSVVSTVKASIELIHNFINYYKGIGADKIYLYLDDVNDKDILNEYQKDKNVIITLCDDAYWNIDYGFDNFKFIGRPESIEERQKHNLCHVLKFCETEWLLSVDIDELIFSEYAISDLLLTIPENVFSLRIKPYEATYELCEPKSIKEVFLTKYFKHREKRFDDFFWNSVLPKESFHREGFFGHTVGKAFLRTSKDLKVPGIHNQYPLDSSLIDNFWFKEIKLLHFEALTPDIFIQKNINRANNIFKVSQLGRLESERVKYIADLYKQSGVEGLYKLYSSMHVLSSNVIESAKKLFLLEEIDINKQGHRNIGNYLTTIHNTIIVYNEEVNKVQSIEFNAIDSNNYSPVFFNFDINKGIGYFFFIKDKISYYLFPDENGYLVSYPSRKSIFYGVEVLDKINTQFAIFVLSSKLYLTITPKGEVRFRAEQVQAWEKISLLDDVS